MIRLVDRPPASSTLEQLSEYQREANQSRSYSRRIDDAARLWKLRNVKSNRTFKSVKRALDAMCSGARRCGYCEDSMADEVEHIKPKNLFPELAFVWENYLYACGPCNGPKRAQYATMAAGRIHPFVRTRDKPIRRPPAGADALLDPRREDPLDFLWLDLTDTFHFLPLRGLRPAAQARAAYTLDVLRLNARDALLRARAAALSDYLRHLEAYATARTAGATRKDLTARRTDILARQHPTVFREMQRQPGSRRDIEAAFVAVPEALHW